MPANVYLLALSQALSMTGVSLVMTVTALVGFALAHEKSLATLPLALLYLGLTACTLPASFFMRRFGRRAGFIVGGLCGATGAGLSSLAIVANDFWMFAVACAFFGAANSFAQYYRFAAAESTDVAHRGRAIAFVLAGGVVAAVAGPNLARLTRDALGPTFAGSYVALILLQLAIVALVAFLRAPAPVDATASTAARPLATIARQPTFWLAVLAGTIGYSSMSLLMTATPLAMQDHQHSFGDTAWVIEWHLLGMFAPAFFTGNLIRRFGAAQIILAGGALTLTGAGINLSGTALWQFWLALALVGVGWNFMYIGATTLLTQTHTPAESAKAQGVNELLMWGSVSAASLSAGALQYQWGWAAVNLAVLPLLLLPLAGTLWLLARRRLPVTG